MIERTRGRRAAGEDIGRLGLLLALLIGGLLRLWDLTSASQHTDEAFTFALSAMPIPALLANVAAHDFHPPLFYLVTHYLMVWLPKPQWDYRFITALAGCLTIVGSWGAARRMFGPVAAAVAALAVALAPALVQHDRIYRMYALTVALSTLLWWLVLEIEHASGRRRAWLTATYAVLAVALPSIDYFGFLVLLTQGAYALTRRASLWPVLAAIGISFAAFVPWFGALREQLPLAGISMSRPGIDVGLAKSIQGAFAAGMPDAWLSWPGAAFAPALVLAVVVLVAGWLGRKSALPFWIGALALQIAGSLLLVKNLAYFPRYLLIDVPPVCIAIGLIVCELIAARLRLAAAALGIALVTFFAITISNVMFVPYYQFPDWYALNALMLAHEQPGDAVILDAGYEAYVVHDFTAFRGREVLRFMNPSDFDPLLRWIAHHPRRRVWYVQAQNFYWDPSARIASELERTRPAVLRRRWPRQSPVDDVLLILFDKKPMTIR
ncbi:MAG: glycosyltransferase family 39 protein [Candidatus Eremiobacteraeota bacterium]|nr:glycosyltransferase family 39 protein [Candidatus Eremiobacteraeota bacterium]